MNSRDKLVNKLCIDVKKLENKIEHRKLYNIRNVVLKSFLKSGIALDYAFPFIIASIVIALSYQSKDKSPFRIDEITQKASVETIDTSSGIHLENISYDFDYNNKLIEYSTGWIINDKGLYERTVTSYRLSDKLDLSKTDEILSMSKEEIEKILVVTNVQKICKNILTLEDEIYNSNALIIVNHKKSDNEIIIRKETSEENLLQGVLYIIESLIWGNSFRLIEKVFVKTYLRDKLVEYETSLRLISKEELEEMKKILELKKQNLTMINETTTNISESYAHSLRKDKIEKNDNVQYVLKKI